MVFVKVERIPLVYFAVGYDEDGEEFIKIGRTGSPAQRFKTLKSYNGYSHSPKAKGWRLRKFARLEIGHSGHEAAYHARFRETRVNNTELFRHGEILDKYMAEPVETPDEFFFDTRLGFLVVSNEKVIDHLKVCQQSARDVAITELNAVAYNPLLTESVNRLPIHVATKKPNEIALS